MTKTKNTFQKIGGLMLLLMMYVSVCSAAHKNLHDDLFATQTQTMAVHSTDTGEQHHGHTQHHEEMGTECCTSVVTNGKIIFQFFLQITVFFATLVVLLSLILPPSAFKSYFSFLKLSPPVPRTLVRLKTCMIC